MDFFCVLEIIDKNDMADTLAVDSEWTCFIASWALVADIFFFPENSSEYALLIDLFSL